MIEKLLLVVIVTTLCMLSPGPDMILVMRNTVTGDRRSGGLTALGVLTGNMVHIGYCVLGIALLLSRSPVVYNVLRVSSAIYLVYLGVRSLRSDHATKGSKHDRESGIAHENGAKEGHGQGAVRSLGLHGFSRLAGIPMRHHVRTIRLLVLQ